MQVWQQAKALAPAQGDGLTLDQFAVALRLVALVQVTPVLAAGMPGPVKHVLPSCQSSDWQQKRGAAMHAVDQAPCQHLQSCRSAMAAWMPFVPW